MAAETLDDVRIAEVVKLDMRTEIQGLIDGLQTPHETAEHLHVEMEEVADLIFLSTDDMFSTPPRVWCDLNDLAAATTQRFQSSISARKTLTFEAAEIPVLVSIIPEFIQRALSNLIVNAIHYTPADGHIDVSIMQTKMQIKLSVQDTGIGIEADHLPFIFDRFYRTDASRNIASGGRGLGLSIVRQIMELHEATVTVPANWTRGVVLC